MPNVPALWLPGCRKEVLDLLSELWPSLDEAQKDSLSTSLGRLPAELLARISDDTDRTAAGARLVFDRINAIQRTGSPLTEALQQEQERIAAKFPNWRFPEGESAHFSMWSGTGWQRREHQAPEDLRAFDASRWKQALETADWDRDDTLSSWRDLARDDPQYAMTFLRGIAASDDASLLELWSYGFQGLREGVKEPQDHLAAFSLLEEVGNQILADPRISSAAVDFLEAVTDKVASSDLGSEFWSAFDRVLVAASADPANEEAPDQHSGWVSLAINRSMGRLATAFLNTIFSKHLLVGQGIPPEFTERFKRLLNADSPAHRPARVVAASRLSYLYAVDPNFTSTHILPLFSWVSEDESQSAWAGYTWQPRIDRQLWDALKDAFLASFTQQRLEAMEPDTQRVMGQLLALVGIEFGLHQVSSNVTKAALRLLPPAARADVARWIADYVEQNGDGEGGTDDETIRDRTWTRSVSPWLVASWPPENSLRSGAVSRKLARAAIATSAAFPSAVDTIAPLMTPSGAESVVRKLSESPHPTTYPESSLKLLTLVLSTDEPIYDMAPLRDVIDRLRAAQPQIAEQATFRAWNEFLRLRGM